MWAFVLFVHLLCVCVWIGGQVLLVAAVPAIRGTAGDGARPVIAAIARRFGALGGAALLGIIVTGFAQASHAGVSFGFGGSAYDRQVTEKVVLVVAMIVLTGVHGLLGRRVNTGDDSARRLSRAASLATLVLGLVALWIAADLSH